MASYIPTDDEDQKREIELRWNPEVILNDLGRIERYTYAHQKDVYISCPFHDDSGAHCSVHKQAGIFRCLYAGCGEHGDFWKLLQKIMGRNFGNVVIAIGQRPDIDVGQPKMERNARDRESRAQLALKAYVNYCHDQLLLNAEALDFLYDRGFTEETIISHKWGWAGSKAPIPRSKHYGEADLLHAGLLCQGRNGIRRTFYERITLPIVVDRQVADIQARTIQPDREPKYMNLPSRAKNLWGIKHVQAGGNTVVCEGIFDAALSTQVGTPAVAILGGDQTHMAWLDILPETSCLTLAFDNDPAGRYVTERVGMRFMSTGHVVKVAELPEGEDPASFINVCLQNCGGDPILWQEIVEEAVDFPVWLARRIPKGEICDPFKQQKLVEPVLQTLRKQEPIYRETLIDRLGEELGIARRLLVMQLNAKGKVGRA